jgi:hypothetical protein
MFKMANSATFRKMVKTLRLQVPVNFWLRHFPVVKTLPGGKDLHLKKSFTRTKSPEPPSLPENKMKALAVH